MIHFSPRGCWDPRDSCGTKEAASGHLTPALKSPPALKCWNKCWKQPTTCLKTLHSLGLLHPGCGPWEISEISPLGKAIRSIPLPSPHAFRLAQSITWQGASPWSHPTTQIHTNLSLPECQALPGFFSEHLAGCGEPDPGISILKFLISYSGKFISLLLYVEDTIFAPFHGHFIKDKTESGSWTELGLRFLLKQINIFLPIYIKAFLSMKSHLFLSNPLDFSFHFQLDGGHFAFRAFPWAWQ